MKPPDYEYISQLLSQADPIEVHLTPEHAFILVGLLQLALRHPGLTGPDETAKLGKRIGTNMAKSLQAKLNEIDPAIGLILERGWHPEWDMTEEEFDQHMQEESDDDFLNDLNES
jgi:hypothetical protein